MIIYHYIADEPEEIHPHELRLEDIGIGKVFIEIVQPDHHHNSYESTCLLLSRDEFIRLLKDGQAWLDSTT